MKRSRDVGSRLGFDDGKIGSNEVIGGIGGPTGNIKMMVRGRWERQKGPRSLDIFWKVTEE